MDPVMKFRSMSGGKNLSLYLTEKKNVGTREKLF